MNVYEKWSVNGTFGTRIFKAPRVWTGGAVENVSHETITIMHYDTSGGTFRVFC